MENGSDRTVEVGHAGRPVNGTADLSVHEAMHLMDDKQLSTLPVTTPESELLGMVLRSDLGHPSE
jgi:CBS domain-containing protein